MLLLFEFVVKELSEHFEPLKGVILDFRVEALLDDFEHDAHEH